jgi:error-prone DNA polymerase
MGARLLLVEGKVQKSPEGAVHLMAEKIFDRSAELYRLSDNHEARAELSRADIFFHSHSDTPRSRHPRDVRILPKSRDFH